jgi:hypothetical protein
MAMATPTTIADAIEQTALNPKSVFTDKAKVDAHDIASLLAARRHEAAATAMGENHFGLRFVKLEAPGAG